MGVHKTPYGTYIARWTDPYGDRRSKSGFRYKADATAFYNRMISDMARGQYVDPRAGRVTLEDWTKEWLAGARNLGTGGREIYERDLKRHILPVLGKVKLGNLKPALIDAYLNGLTLQPSSVHRHYRTLHRAMAVAVERGLVSKNPVDPVQPPRVPKREVTVLTVEQIDALADAISPRYRAWVFVAAYGGLRWSETVGLRRMDVEISRDDPGRRSLITGVVRVRGQLVKRKGGWERCETKTGRPRTITLPAFAAGELAYHLDTYALDGPDGLVFPTRNGTPPQAPSWTQNIFKRALVKAGLPGMRVHDLRHCAVSMTLAVTNNPLLSQLRAGHSSADIHQRTYGHLLAGADQGIADALDALRAESRRKRLRAV